MTWLTGWIYQKAHTITGSSGGIQTDYPVGIKVYYGPGADGEEVLGGATFGKVYCDSECKTDFGDIRFTKSDGLSLLDYWIEEQVNSDYAIIWVEIDSIPANPGTVDIYIYYGNAGATTTSNADDVFLIFNDCATVAGWSEQYIAGTPAWGAVVEDGVDTIYIEANAHNEKLRIQYDTTPMTGRENQRALTRVKHTSWNADGYFNWYTPLLIGSPSEYDALRYSSYLDYYTIYASVGGVSDTTTHNEAHPSGWYRYEKKTNAAGEVTGYRDNTDMGTSTVDGDYSGGKVMFYVNEWNSGLTKHYIDWFAIAKYVDPEPTHTAWGPATAEGAEDLAAGFWVKEGEADLFCRLQVMTHLDLPAKFDAIRSDSFALPASFRTGGRGIVPARFRVTKYYDLEGTGGIAFYWWGAANPVEAMNQLILESPTGFWYTDFYDGPAAWRLVEIPWGSFTWVSAPQRRLEPHRYWPYPPDQSQIDAFIWTVHTHGLRRLDYVYAYPRVPDASLSAKLSVRNSASQSLGAGFMIRQVATSDLPASFDGQVSLNLPAEFIVRHIVTPLNLPAAFEVRQGFNDLSAKFTVTRMNLYTSTDTVYWEDTTAAWTLIPSMTLTVPTAAIGDKIIVTMSCTMRMGYPVSVKLRMMLNSAEFPSAAFEHIFSPPYGTSFSAPITICYAYEVTTPGIQVIEIQTYGHNSYRNKFYDRHMIVQHFIS